MIDSRDINDLRPDVAANVKIFVDLMAAKGYPVGFSSTYRDDEIQAKLYAQGRTAPGQIVTNSKVTTFHGVRLAFDIYQNADTFEKQWNDAGFWSTARALLTEIGFSPISGEQSHSQWDDGKKYTGSMVRAGRLPPSMPLYQEEDTMTQDQFDALYNEVNPMVKTINDVPEVLRPEVQALLSKGAINGGTPANVSAIDINQRLETLKAAVIAARAK